MPTPAIADHRLAVATLILLLSVVTSTFADDAGTTKPRRLLLLAQGPDGHPFSTHEYTAGAEVLSRLLHPFKHVQAIVVNADEPWTNGPELLDGADGAVVFLSEGARWLQQDNDRLAAFQRLAARGGGLVCLHWGMGTRDAANIQNWVDLFGGCHGGPDRRYKVVDVDATVAAPEHSIARGLSNFKVRDEFYYTLKFTRRDGELTPLIRVPIDDGDHTVCWAWQRPDGGRSFGFSGLHFHDNWQRPEYRRLLTQGVLWTLHHDIPPAGVDVDIAPKHLQLAPQDERP